jgi:hypothetical protein
MPSQGCNSQRSTRSVRVGERQMGMCRLSDRMSFSVSSMTSSSVRAMALAWVVCGCSRNHAVRACFSSGTPWPCLALISRTGMPSWASRCSVRTLMPRCLASSAMFRARNMGRPRDFICSTRASWRSSWVVLSTTRMPLRGWVSTKRRATRSSSEKPCRLCRPGRSTSSTMPSPSSSLADSSSTVRPGQLPTLAPAPVRRLNRVDLPVLGMPTRAMRLLMSGFCSG